MRKTLLFTLVVVCLAICVTGRKTSVNRGSRSGSGRPSKTNYAQPAPTSFSNPQPSAPKPSLFGWQQKPAEPAKSYTSWQSKPSNSQGHSYPSSQTGLSGSNKQLPVNQDSIQRSNSPQNFGSQHSPSHSSINQNGHSYPASNGLSGSGSGYPQQHGTGLSGSGPGGVAPGYPQQHGSGLSGSGNSGVAPGYPQQQASGLSGSSGSQGYPQHPSGIGAAHSGYPQQSNSFPGSGAVPPPYSGYNSANGQKNIGNNYYHPQGPPPAYSPPGYGGYGGNGFHNPGPQTPGYFGNYANYGKGFGGPSRASTALTGVGIAGAGVGTLLTGLALWNLARSTGQRHHTVIYDNRGQPVAVAPTNETAPAVDPFLADLANCTLTISGDNATEVLAIPCAIATSFSPDADVKESNVNNPNDNTKCTVTVITKTGKEYMTTIPCSTLLNTAAENNVTEPPLIKNETDSVNVPIVPTGTDIVNLDQPSASKLSVEDKSLNCTYETGEIRDPINPCYSVTHNLTVVPIDIIEKSAPASAA